MSIPHQIPIYHIVHISRLQSIVSSGLFSDAYVRENNLGGTSIGMQKIKDRRLHLQLASQPGLHVGECVPFYFCPRSVMLYVISRRNNAELAYTGGQESVVHLVADFHRTVEWATQRGLRWAFTTSNAGSAYFDDFSTINDLSQIDWDAVYSMDWRMCIDSKQAEFLVERQFPWELVEEIGVFSNEIAFRLQQQFAQFPEFPMVRQRREWYY